MTDKSVDVGVGIVDHQVVLKFPNAIEYLTMDSENALNIASAMSDAAFECRDGVKPVNNTLKAELVEKHRIKLTQRVALMMNTLRQDKLKTDGQIAKSVVDTCLAEIF